MSKFLGVIACNYRLDLLQSMITSRPVAALPFGGRYRLLDFPLSSMVNSGLRTVGIITPYRYRPILDHLGAGKEWYLDRKVGGMFILPGSLQGKYSRNNKFALGDFVKNIEFLEKDRADYVIISGCSNIFNLNFNEVMQEFEDQNPDIIMIYKELYLEEEEDCQGVILQVNENKRVVNLKSSWGKEKQIVKLFIDTLIIKRKLFLDILKNYEAVEEMDLLDILEEDFEMFRIAAYPLAGYFGRITSVRSYYRRSMDILNPSVRNELFMKTNRIHTKIKDNPPTKYGVQCSIRNSLISSGCNIQGNVRDSIVFRGVRIESGASVTKSIIMQKCVIGEEAVLENVIIDKYGRVNNGAVIKGQDYSPMVLSKYMVL
jgi:glucose-1-phosphate adenylyltransferase